MDDSVVMVPASVLRICREELYGVLHRQLENSLVGDPITNDDAELLANVINALGDGNPERARVNPLIRKAMESDRIGL